MLAPPVGLKPSLGPAVVPPDAHRTTRLPHQPGAARRVGAPAIRSRHSADATRTIPPTPRYSPPGTAPETSPAFRSRTSQTPRCTACAPATVRAHHKPGVRKADSPTIRKKTGTATRQPQMAAPEPHISGRPLQCHVRRVP